MSESLGAGSPSALAGVHDVGLFDLDGVLYVGPDAVPGAPGAVRAAVEAGLRPAYVTNNAARTPETVAGHLRELGFPATVEDVVTSAQAAASVLVGLVAAGSPVLVVGGEGLRDAVTERGLVPLDEADAAMAVVQGFGPDVGWRLLAEGTYAVGRGLPWVASNLDATVPTPKGRAPGNGALVGVIAAATGRRPDVVAGKPEPAMHAESMRRTGAVAPLVVGDRLDTDIEGAVRAGVPSLLVLTGVDGPAEVVRAKPGQRPTYLAKDLAAGLLAAHPAVVAKGAGWGCGGWTVGVRGVEVSVHGSGDPVDGLRALCLAWWSAGEALSDADPGPALSRLGW